jgi:AcrR family transcriptional regulator
MFGVNSDTVRAGYANRSGARPTPMAHPARKSTQRERLLRGMVDTTNRRGYAGASVSAVIEEAGVSRPTFYEYFSDRDDCFRAAIEDAHTRLLNDIEEAIAAATQGTTIATTVGALVRYASTEPARARFLMGEAMAGGKRALDTRDCGIAQITKTIEKGTASGPADAAVPDLEARVAIGTAYRLIARRLRRGEAAITELADDLLAWLAAYERPAGERRWQELTPGLAPAASEPLPDLPTQRMPSVLPPGRPRISEDEIAENHRRRVLYAVAELAEKSGYTATTVSAITKLARIDGTAFYRLFSDKQEAFAAVHELCFQQAMDATAKGFFSGEDWPRRSWAGARTLTQLLQANTRLTHVGFVEAYAVGPGAVQRIEDSHVAFMFFLQEGLLHRDAPAPSRVAMEATIAAIFEIVYLDTRRDGEPRIASLLAHVAHVWLTPFMGIEQADAFIDAQQGAAQPRRTRAGGRRAK